jgi:ATP-dependent Lon protease
MMNFEENEIELPESLPLLPVRDIVVFPYMILPLFVGRDSSIKAVEDALARNRLIFLASQKEIAEEKPSPDSIYDVGTVAMIMRMRKLADGRIKILIQGVGKARVKDYIATDPSYEVKIDRIEDEPASPSDIEIEAMIRTAKEHLEKIIAHGKMLSPDILLVLDEVNDPGRLADLIASNLGLKVNDAQSILETTQHKERLRLVNELLANELEVLAMQARIRNTAKDEMTKSQKEYFLREQLRAIKSELGEAEGKTEDADELRDKIAQANMPPEVETEALKQLARLDRMHPDASEASMLRTYLDWLIDVPWSISTEDNLDLDHAKKILDEDHFDLRKAKDRILEFLAVRQLKNDMKGPILCFVGPPGVGKTSLGKSIARSMNRQYSRVALGGVKDEAEIRGHRRTYVGAMPGKIVQALKQVKTNNPVFVLDEVDKLGSDFRGDPSAAMLEVLDPEQNSTFRDNYLNVDFDLSNVLFLATANTLETIPAALRDRMEIIQLSGYTDQDKIHIARDHLIHRQKDGNGLKDENIEFQDDGIQTIISDYTREAGVRNLEREIGSVCRKVAKLVVDGSKETHVINRDEVHDLLGSPKFMRDEEARIAKVGVATGLAWTSFGGEVLYVEAIKMKGKGGLVLTGRLGDVMQESAKAAMSYAKAHAEDLGIDDTWFDEHDVHIHFPEGATPKDGPSAGITIATALISLITDAEVRNDICMTGEVTLTGRVLPIGGVREKALAALRQGIKNVIIPHQNAKDLNDIPEELRKQLNFILVKQLDEVLSNALKKNPKAKKSASSSSSGNKRVKSTKVAAPAA